MDTIANKRRKACMVFCSDYLKSEGDWVLSQAKAHGVVTEASDADERTMLVAMAQGNQQYYAQQSWLRRWWERQSIHRLNRYVETAALREALEKTGDLQAPRVISGEVAEQIRKTASLWSYFSSTRRFLNQTASFLSMHNLEVDTKPYKPIRVDNEQALSVWLDVYANQLSTYKRSKTWFLGETHEQAMNELSFNSPVACEKSRRDRFQQALSGGWDFLGRAFRQDPEQKREDKYLYVQSLHYAIEDCQRILLTPAQDPIEKESAFETLTLLLKEGCYLFEKSNSECAHIYQSMNTEWPDYLLPIAQAEQQSRIDAVSLIRARREQEARLKGEHLERLRRPFHHFDAEDIQTLQTYVNQESEDALSPIKNKIVQLSRRQLDAKEILLSDTEVETLKQGLEASAHVAIANKLDTIAPLASLFKRLFRHERRTRWYLACRNTGLEKLWWPSDKSIAERAIELLRAHHQSLLRESEAAETSDKPMPVSLKNWLNAPQGIDIDIIWTWREWLKSRDPRHPLVDQLSVVAGEGKTSCSITQTVAGELEQAIADLGAEHAKQQALLVEAPAQQNEHWLERLKSFFGFKQPVSVPSGERQVEHIPVVAPRSQQHDVSVIQDEQILPPLLNDRQKNIQDQLEKYDHWLKGCALTRNQYLGFFNLTHAQALEQQHAALAQQLDEIKQRLVEWSDENATEIIQAWIDQQSQYIQYFNANQTPFFSNTLFWRAKLRYLGYHLSSSEDKFLSYKNIKIENDPNSSVTLNDMDRKYRKMMQASHVDRPMTLPQPVYILLTAKAPWLNEALKNKPDDLQMRPFDALVQQQRYAKYEKYEERILSLLNENEPVAFIQIENVMYYAIKPLHLLLRTECRPFGINANKMSMVNESVEALPCERLTRENLENRAEIYTFLEDYHKGRYQAIFNQRINHAKKEINEASRLLLSEEKLTWVNQNQGSFSDLELKLFSETRQYNNLCTNPTVEWNAASDNTHFIVRDDQIYYKNGHVKEYTLFLADAELRRALFEAISSGHSRDLTPQQRGRILPIIHAPWLLGQIYLRITANIIEYLPVQDGQTRPLWHPLDEPLGSRNGELYQAILHEDLSNVSIQCQLNLLFDLGFVRYFYSDRQSFSKSVVSEQQAAELYQQSEETIVIFQQTERAWDLMEQELEVLNERRIALNRDLAMTKADLATTKVELTTIKEDLATTKAELTMTKREFEEKLAVSEGKAMTYQKELTTTKEDLAKTKADLAKTNQKFSEMEESMKTVQATLLVLASQGKLNIQQTETTPTVYSPGLFGASTQGSASSDAENIPSLT